MSKARQAEADAYLRAIAEGKPEGQARLEAAQAFEKVARRREKRRTDHALREQC